MADIPEIVADEETLHRLLNPRANAVKDGRIHYMAFYSGTEPHRISVDRASYRSREESLRAAVGCGLASLVTMKVRQLDLAPDPPLRVEGLPENGNAAHAEIQAESSIPKKKVKTKVCVRLVDVATMVLAPP